MADRYNTDVVIVGAGPVGLFAVFELGMLKIRCHVVDALEMPGGQCAALYPEKPIYDIPGHPRIEGQALIDNLLQQLDPFKPHFHLGQHVCALDHGSNAQDNPVFTVKTSSGTEISCGAVIIAAGAGAFGPNRPPLAGLEQYENDPNPAKGVKYLVRRREDFRDQKVVIAGGGDSALDWAISLSEIAASVSLVHRRAKFRAAPESVSRMEDLVQAGKIDLVVPYQLHAVQGVGGMLEDVIVQDLNGQVKHLPADVLLPFYGLSMNLGPIAEWGLDLDKNHIAVNPETAQTNHKGIFAIGDIASYPGKLKLILQGFSEAAVAAHAIHPLLFPGQALHFEYSTSKGLPQ